MIMLPTVIFNLPLPQFIGQGYSLTNKENE